MPRGRRTTIPRWWRALSASFARCLGFWNEVFPKSANVFVAIPAVLLLASALRSRAQELLLGSAVLFLCGHSLVNGYMDGLLALYFTAAALIMARLCGLDGCKRPSAQEFPWLVSAGVLVFAILTLLKNEGAVGLMVLAAAATALCRREQRIRDLLRLWAMAAFALIPLFCWKMTCSQFGIQSNLAEEGIWTRLTTRLLQPGDSAAIAWAMLLRIEIILPFCVLLIFRLAGGGGRRWWFPAITCAIYAGVIALVYLSTPSDLSWHLRTSVDRTILPIAMLLSYVCVNQALDLPFVRRSAERIRPDGQLRFGE